WADSLVALNNTDSAISVLDAVNENALRYVDAQMRLIELYLARISAHLASKSFQVTRKGPPSNELQAVWHDLDLAGRAIAALNDPPESRQFYRFEANWWSAPYNLSRIGQLPKDVPWPDGGKHDPAPREAGKACRVAYRRYLQRAPDAPDREDV